LIGSSSGPHHLGTSGQRPEPRGGNSDYRPATLNVTSDGGSVTSDAVSLGLIVTELILNALKHAFPVNSITDRQIIVRFEVAGSNWKLSVADNGIGAPVGVFMDDLSKSTRGQVVRKYLEGSGPRVLTALDKVAAETGHTLAQVALAWVAAKITAPIASATSVAQVQELIGAMNLELSDAQVAVLDAASA
jgi:light-regulated signal transduction histidine kinase (bacteriophytochrome)